MRILPPFCLAIDQEKAVGPTIADHSLAHSRVVRILS